MGRVNMMNLFNTDVYIGPDKNFAYIITIIFLSVHKSIKFWVPLLGRTTVKPV